MIKKIFVLSFSLLCISTSFALTQGQGKGERFEVGHDDLQGIVSTAIGASALGTISIRSTGFPILCFQNANDDVVYFQYQMAHSKKLDTAIDSVHVHSYLPSAPSAGNTIYFDYAYVIYNNGDVIPDLANWTTGRSTHTFTGTELQYSSPLIVITTSTISVPANETYSAILLMKVVRDSTGVTGDTYNADLGITYTDAHIQKNRVGSFNEGSD